MKISGIQKLSLLDFPGKLCCTVFTEGCNFRCPFCHNGGLVLSREHPDMSEELDKLLEARRGKLDGICITGGEPLLNRDIGELIKKIKSMGYLVKLDTNGSFPERLFALLGDLDYVAMDIKNSPEKYNITAGIPVDIEAVKKSADMLINSGIDFEFRTTVIKGYHTAEDMKKIGEWIKGAGKYYIQNFKNSGDILGKEELCGFSKEELECLKAAVVPYIPTVEIRGE